VALSEKKLTKFLRSIFALAFCEKKTHNWNPELAFGKKKLTTLDRKNQQLPGALKKKPRYLTDKFLAH
jgi:hypothetical protein